MIHLLWVAAFFVKQVVGLNNGVGVKPHMGWDPWNVFRCDADEVRMRQQADLLVSTGFRDLGYNYLMLDCGWQGTARAANGSFTWDTKMYPSGIPALANYAHARNLKFGVYSDAGYYSCSTSDVAKLIGTLGYEAQDAASFASWGADLLKYDFCYAVSPTDFVNYNPDFVIKDRYEVMRDALNKTGRPILYSACEWGLQFPATWPGNQVANAWRISNDISRSWASIVRIINQVLPFTGYSGPGGFNDLDMLEVGNPGLTADEQKTHMAFWAAAKSPLIIGTDLGAMSDTTRAILNNTNIIAINQDPLGKSVQFRRRYTGAWDIWSGPLADGSTVAVVINWKAASSSVTLNLADLGFASAQATEVWAGKSLGLIRGSYTTTLPAHGSLTLKLTSTTAAPARSFTTYAAGAASNVLTGTAKTRTVGGTTVVGYIGAAGSLTWKGLNGGSGGTKLLSLDYIMADQTPPTTMACENCRDALFSVNGGANVTVNFPLSGASWDTISKGYLVELPGFVAGTANTVTVTAAAGNSPDFAALGVQK